MMLFEQGHGHSGSIELTRFSLGFGGGGLITSKRRSKPGHPGVALAMGGTHLAEPPLTLLELWYRHGAETDPNAVYIPSAKDGYWKIGITLSDVDRARHRLQSSGVSVSDPHQFLDIGYLCHLADPDGYCIELLQHDFAQNYRPSPPRHECKLGSAPTLGQITLRIKDPAASLRFYGEVLGMRLLCRQVVEPHRFTLYFLACTDEEPPDADLDAMENREWLWKRSYTMLELQHVWGTEHTDFAYDKHEDDSLGFWGISFATQDLPALIGELEDRGVHITTPLGFDPTLQANTALVLDPDGFRVRLAEMDTSNLS